MREFWIGLGLLLSLLAVGVGTASVMSHIHDPIARDLEQASQAALEDNWKQALYFSARAQKAWHKHWHITSAAADHTPMEEIDSLFAEMEIFAREGEKVHFAACCAQLSRQTKAVGEAHGINWKNVL